LPAIRRRAIIFQREVTPMKWIHRFCKSEIGQDITEYTLLLVLAVLGSAGFMMNSNTSVSSIWNSTNSALNGTFAGLPAGNGGGGGGGNTPSTPPPSNPPSDPTDPGDHHHHGGDGGR
jgi:Flp pilus assembly pilin Flp